MRSSVLTQVFMPLPDRDALHEHKVISHPSASTFELIKLQLVERLGNEVYSSWFGRLKLEPSVTKGIIRISVPTAFLRSWITNHYLEMILDIWKEEEPDVVSIEVMVRSAARNITINEFSDSSIKKSRGVFQNNPALRKIETQDSKRFESSQESFRPRVLGSPLDARYQFDSFIEGPSNRVAFAAARSIAESPSHCARFNPLFLHASVGMGKTHLLQAIAAESIKQNSRACVVYLTAEYFMWRFATAIRDNNALTFKEQLRDIDLLIIDDMQFLQGKSIQNEFCHLLNMLLDSARQVVVAADRPPSELDSLEQRVRSRLIGGMALEIGTPDYDMRLDMLRQRLEAAKATEPSLAISDEILEHIAKTIAGSGRDLEGAFNQLLFRQTFEPNIDINRVDDILRHIYRSGEEKRIRIEDIQRIVSQHYNVSKADLLSTRRTRTIVRPRQAAMYLCKIMTPRSLPEIGRRFGGRDHTTVLHAIRKIENLVESDNGLTQELELLRRLILDQA